MKMKSVKWIKPSLLMRVMILLFLSFGMKLFFSCTPPPPVDIFYNSVRLIGIDNSGQFMRSYENIDTIYSNAMALKLTILDTSYNYYASLNGIMKSLSFSTAMALSINEAFNPVNKVVQIKVQTLFDVDDDIKAGDDISIHILYADGYDFELYESVNSAISRLNGTQNMPGGTVEMVFEKSIKNTKAQFYVEITLDNGQVLSCVSDTFTIIGA
ncbi:MAG: hypothetical protein PHU27_12775 [Salinivirgaceae bacterium]|nr:hypothetical protein [Salinivirgaceae bacterium]MDD4746692.1 hypothetical protein [Salinivirgaceae bacterium]